MAGTLTVSLTTKLTDLGSTDSRSNSFKVSGLEHVISRRFLLSTNASATFKLTGMTSCKLIVIRNVSANDSRVIFVALSTMTASGHGMFRIVQDGILMFAPRSAGTDTIKTLNPTSGTILGEYAAYGTE